MIRDLRAPGPLGLVPGGSAGRPPGPLAFIPPIFPAPKQAQKATKQLRMPAPASDGRTKVAREVGWNLSGKAPALGDVKQGSLANCPLAAVLAALAHTAIGQKHLASMVTSHTGVVETDLSAVADQLTDPPDSGKIVSSRYYTVALGGKSFEVSDVLYTDDADRNWDPIYMRSPTEVLWPCIIEKAYAEKEGGYSALDSAYGKGLSLNDVWTAVLGKKPGGFAVSAGTPESKIRDAAEAAGKVPTVAASKEAGTVAVTGWHGFAVLGMKGKNIEVYDPDTAKRKTLSLTAFRGDFQAVLHGSP